jgi:hypothetical protein
MTVKIEADDGVKVDNGEKLVAEQKAEAAGRKPAPNIQAPDNFVDHRKRKIDALNARNDGYEYRYTSRDKLTDEDMEFAEAEVVKYTEGARKGKIMRDGDDPIIRRKKEPAVQARIQMEKFSEAQVKAVTKNAITNVKRQKKEPSK